MRGGFMGSILKPAVSIARAAVARRLLTAGRTLLLAAAVAVGALCVSGCGDSGTTPNPNASGGGGGGGGTPPSDDSLSYKGLKYKTVVINGKRWMAQNLNYNPNDGNSWCFEDSPDSCAKYGRLYNWESATAVCPTGWHLPARQEWGDLAVFAGGAGDYGTEGAAAKKLKSKSGWNYGGVDGNGTDNYGFSALPGGHRHSANGFIVDGRGMWWTSTEGQYSDQAYRRDMISADDIAYEYSSDKVHAFSVRCVEGKATPPTPPKEDSTFTDDRDGQVYKKVKINGQTWMAQNLNHDPEDGRSCCFGGSPDSCAKYGRLYEWESAMTVCPIGWRLPTREEWGDLAKYAGGTGVYGDTGTAAVKLKSKSGWNYGGVDGNGTDDFGFSALPGGYRHVNDGFINNGRGGWWTASNATGSLVYRRQMTFDGANVFEYETQTIHNFSVRCVENSSAAR